MGIASSQYWMLLASIVCSFLVGCRTSSLERPLASTNEDWPTLGRSLDRKSAIDDTAGNAAPLFLWSAAIDAGVLAAPIILDQTLFVATLKGTVLVRGAGDGDEIASFKLRQPIKATPAIRDSVMVVASASGTETLEAVNLLDGSVRWSARVGPVESSPIIIDTVVIVATMEGVVHALSVSTGREFWTHHPDKNNVRRSIRSTAAADEMTVVVASDDGTVLALSLIGGKMLWKTQTSSSIAASPVLSNGRVIIANSAGVVCCLDKLTGSRVWEVPLGAAVYVTPACDGDGVYVGVSTGEIIALDERTGTRLWEHAGGGPVSATVAMSDVVIYGSYDCKVIAISKSDGVPVWVVETQGRVRVAPIVWQKKLFWVSDDRLVSCYALQNERSQPLVSLDIALTKDFVASDAAAFRHSSAPDSIHAASPSLAQSRLRQWSLIASAGTGFASGVLAATWKAQADRASDAFRRTQDPKAKSDMKKFDTRSAIAFAVMQASTAFLTYLLLAD